MNVEEEMCSWSDRCRLPNCRIQTLRYVYGLWDAQLDNIFYVGSTFNLLDRFSRHLRENEYALKMLDRGAYPIPLLLLVFYTRCDEYSREIEHSIALQLRAQGHYAFGDDIFVGHYASIVDEQARQLQFLRDMYNE